MNEPTAPSTAEKPDKGWELTKKIAKIVFRLLLLYCIVSCVIYCIPSLREGYWEAYTTTFVLIHQKGLNEFVENYPLDEPKTSQKYHGWRAISYPVQENGIYENRTYDFYNGDPYIIQFDRFGFGLVPSTSYAGMYYSPEDTPVGFQGTLLNAPGSPDCETTKICDHWYWYIAWF